MKKPANSGIVCELQISQATLTDRLNDISLDLSVFQPAFLPPRVNMDADSYGEERSQLKRSSSSRLCMRDGLRATEQEHVSLELVERCPFIVLMLMRYHFTMLYMAAQ